MFLIIYLKIKSLSKKDQGTLPFKKKKKDQGTQNGMIYTVNPFDMTRVEMRVSQMNSGPILFTN